MHYRTLAFGAMLSAASVFCTPAQAGNEAVTAQLQQIIDNYLQQNAGIENITGIALQVSLGDTMSSGDVGPVIALTSGTDGLRDPQPMTASTLFEIGSNTKSFTSALILMLEANGKLNIDQTVGDWLPEYPAWKSVKIRSLLNMTSGIPSYDSTVAMTEKEVSLHYQFTFEQLIGFVDPDEGAKISPTTGWSYSNTNYFLAALIIERASGMSYTEALRKLLIKPLRLRDTYYFYGPIPEYVLGRIPAGFFNDPTCIPSQPEPCTVSVLAPLLGKDVRAENMSWAGPAGGIIATLGDLATWWRAVFATRVFPQTQLEEFETMVSQTTGLPIAETDASNPAGFGLGIAREYSVPFGGSIWAYEGETRSMRVVFAYWPQYNLVITMAANSNVSDKIDPDFPQTVLPAALTALLNTGTIQASGSASKN